MKWTNIERLVSRESLVFNVKITYLRRREILIIANLVNAIVDMLSSESNILHFSYGNHNRIKLCIISHTSYFLETVFFLFLFHLGVISTLVSAIPTEMSVAMHLTYAWQFSSWQSSYRSWWHKLKFHIGNMKKKYILEVTDGQSRVKV